MSIESNGPVETNLCLFSIKNNALTGLFDPVDVTASSTKEFDQLQFATTEVATYQLMSI